MKAVKDGRILSTTKHGAYMIYVLLTACLAAADLVTKALARRDRHIKKIYNPGFSFGFLKEHPFIIKGIPTPSGSFRRLNGWELAKE